MGNVITIDDGLKTYDIANKKGDILGSFSFNPTDTNIIKRYHEVVSALEKMEIPGAKNEEETTENELEKMEEIVFEKIDYLLNSKISKDFFSIMGPFSPLASGQYFVESVLDAIGQAIQAETGERVKKINSKIKKHTSKYHG